MLYLAGIYIFKFKRVINLQEYGEKGLRNLVTDKIGRWLRLIMIMDADDIRWFNALSPIRKK